MMNSSQRRQKPDWTSVAGRSQQQRRASRENIHTPGRRVGGGPPGAKTGGGPRSLGSRVGRPLQQQKQDRAAALADAHGSMMLTGTRPDSAKESQLRPNTVPVAANSLARRRTVGDSRAQVAATQQDVLRLLRRVGQPQQRAPPPGSLAQDLHRGLSMNMVPRTAGGARTVNLGVGVAAEMAWGSPPDSKRRHGGQTALEASALEAAALRATYNGGNRQHHREQSQQQSHHPPAQHQQHSGHRGFGAAGGVQQARRGISQFVGRMVPDESQVRDAVATTAAWDGGMDHRIRQHEEPTPADLPTNGKAKEQRQPPTQWQGFAGVARSSSAPTSAAAASAGLGGVDRGAEAVATAKLKMELKMEMRAARRKQAAKVAAAASHDLAQTLNPKPAARTAERSTPPTSGGSGSKPPSGHGPGPRVQRQGGAEAGGGGACGRPSVGRTGAAADAAGSISVSLLRGAVKAARAPKGGGGGPPVSAGDERNPEKPGSTSGSGVGPRKVSPDLAFASDRRVPPCALPLPVPARLHPTAGCCAVGERRSEERQREGAVEEGSECHPRGAAVKAF